MRGLVEDNPWTHFTGGSPLQVDRVLQLAATLGLLEHESNKAIYESGTDGETV